MTLEWLDHQVGRVEVEGMNLQSRLRLEMKRGLGP
jgi:hypothetical protein